MKSFTTLRNDYGNDTRNTTSSNLTYGDGQMNDFHKRLLAKADWPFLHRLRTTTTQANTTFVPLTYDIDQLESIFVTVGSTRYVPRPAPSRQFWDDLHYNTQTSDTPQYWFVFNGELGLWPRPSTEGNTISMNAKIRPIDLTVADGTTNTIASVTSGSTAMAVSGGVTTQMGGFWIQPTFSTLTNKGDGQWYEISSVSAGTLVTLVRPYGGATITSGTAACVISQMTLLPEAYQDLPEIYAVYRYWLKESNPTRSLEYKSLLTEGLADMSRTYGVNDVSMVIDDGEDRPLINPNLTISL